MTPAETLRAAAASLRCGHSFPVQPPRGSLARPGACSHCGIPWGDHEPDADRLREPLAALLDASAAVIDDHESEDLDVDLKGTEVVLAVAHAILGEVTK